MCKVNFISFPSNFSGKARAVFKLCLGVMCQLKKRTMHKINFCSPAAYDYEFLFLGGGSH